MPPVYYHTGRFPPEELDWRSLIPLIGPTVAALARYDGMLATIPNPSVLLSPLTTQEAVLSTRIEGTQTTIGEVLEFEASQTAVSSERQDDIYEVLNYRFAMHKAEVMLQELPLSQRVIRATHRELLSGVRGRNKSPGEYRRIPNWIGAPGCTIEDAKFVPVAAQCLSHAMDAWERYIHIDAPDLMVQAAVLHAEFESIHPFLDGNGRLGRMLVPLFLWQRGVIGRPMFYISAYFDAHRDSYYGKLLSVSRDDDWTGWCEFFLDAVRVQAEENLVKTKGILDLYELMKPRVTTATNSKYAIHTLDLIFEYPLFRTTEFVSRMIERTDASGPTARRVLNTLIDDGIVKVFRAGKGSRAATMVFPDVLNIAEGRDMF